MKELTNAIPNVPDAAAKSMKAKNQSRKDAVKRIFGIKSESSKGTVPQSESDEIKVHDGIGKEK